MKFPEKGHCLINDEIVKYLENEYILQYNTVAPHEVKDAKIVAWDNNHYWYCLNSSLKPKYEIKELLKLINPKDVGVIKLNEEEAKIATHYLTTLGFKFQGYHTNGFLHVYYHLKSFQFLHSKIDTTYRDLNKEDVGILEKNETFIVGKWYKILDNWWAKFKAVHNSGQRWQFSEKIDKNGAYSNIIQSIDVISEIKLLTDLSEIQEYLPEGHIDKKSEDKIPEYVKLINGWSADEEYMGEVFEMSTLDNLSKFKCHPSKESFRGNIIIWINDGNFRKATKEEWEQQNKPKYEVVHCTTQEEWDFVRNTLPSSYALFRESWTQYGKQ